MDGIELNSEIIRLIKETVDIKALMVSLGFKIYREVGNDLRAPCLIHGGDNPTAFSIRTDTRRWRCFTRECEARSGTVDNDLVSLVMAVRRGSFVDAVQFLAEVAGIPLSGKSADIGKAKEVRRERDISGYYNLINNITSEDSSHKLIPEKTIKTYAKRRDDYFVKAGFQPETLDLFEVGHMVDWQGVPRATIPIRDHMGRLVGMSARRTDGDEEPRYKLEHEFEKSKVLYNLHRAIELGYSWVIIVEGFKAAWAVHEAGFENVVACMGKTVLPRQVSLLLSTKMEGCALMLDGDTAGRKGMESSIKLLMKHFRVKPIYLPDGISPDDFTREELNLFLKERIEN